MCLLCVPNLYWPKDKCKKAANDATPSWMSLNVKSLNVSRDGTCFSSRCGYDMKINVRVQTFCLWNFFHFSSRDCIPVLQCNHGDSRIHKFSFHCEKCMKTNLFSQSTHGQSQFQTLSRSKVSPLLDILYSREH